MKLPPHLQTIKNSTNFTAKEILDFQKKFRKICSRGETELNMKEFVKFMRMMGVKSNATLVSRIFTLMDADGSGSISFGEFMKYFDVLLKGTIESKAEFCFFIIAVGNERNMSLTKDKKFFTRDDLFQLLKIITESQKKHMSMKLAEEDMQGIEHLVSNMMSLLGVESEEEHVTLEKFKKAIGTDENVLGAFQMIGNDLQKLMNYQGDNQFTKVVKALKFVQEQFDRVTKSMDSVDCGMTKISIGNFLSNAMHPPSGSRSNRRSKGGTIIEALEVKLKGVGKKTNLINRRLSQFHKDEVKTHIQKIRDMTYKAQISSGSPSPNFHNSSKPKNFNFEKKKQNLSKYTDLKSKVKSPGLANQSGEKGSRAPGGNTTNSQNNCGTLNLNTTGPFESPAISKLKKRNNQLDQLDKQNQDPEAQSVGVSDINSQTHGNDSMANSSLLADLLKDDPNIVLSSNEVIFILNLLNFNFLGWIDKPLSQTQKIPS